MRTEYKSFNSKFREERFVREQERAVKRVSEIIKVELGLEDFDLSDVIVKEYNIYEVEQSCLELIEVIIDTNRDFILTTREEAYDTGALLDWYIDYLEEKEQLDYKHLAIDVGEVEYFENGEGFVHDGTEVHDDEYITLGNRGLAIVHNGNFIVRHHILVG